MSVPPAVPRELCADPFNGRQLLGRDNCGVGIPTAHLEASPAQRRTCPEKLDRFEVEDFASRGFG